MTAAGAAVLTDVPVVVETQIVADWSGTPWEPARDDAGGRGAVTVTGSRTHAHGRGDRPGDRSDRGNRGSLDTVLDLFMEEGAMSHEPANGACRGVAGC